MQRRRGMKKSRTAKQDTPEEVKASLFNKCIWENGLWKAPKYLQVNLEKFLFNVDEK